MKYFGELVLYCALFTALVKAGVGNSALNGLFFYPEPVQERVYELGLTDRETVKRKRIRFMVPFVLILAGALLGMVRGTQPGAGFPHCLAAVAVLPGRDELV